MTINGWSESKQEAAERWARKKLGGYGWTPKTNDEIEQVRILTNITADAQTDWQAEQERQTAELAQDAEWLQTGGMYMQGEGLINWHNRVVFDVPEMVRQTTERMKPLKERIDARMKAAAERMKRP